MKREFLKELGVTDDIAEKIMIEHGKAVSKSLSDAEELKAENETLKSQIAESEKAVKEFEKSNKDNESLKESLDNLKKEHERIKTESAAQLKAEKVNSAVRLALSESGTKYADLLDSKFDRTKLAVGDDGSITGVKEQIAEMKKQYAELFPDAEKKDPEIKGAVPADPQKQNTDIPAFGAAGQSGIQLNPIFRR
ncbi:MAG: phage scaffolding protein [Bacillota bacterium]|nr:phage scaffolding protein [Bacillota bacterium]